ncbi:FemAB family PEP-CTERM system-associated protein [soil metagenome]
MTQITVPDALRIARATQRGDDAHWDEFVHDSPSSSFCHLSGWGSIIEDVLGREYLPLVAVTSEGEWRGVLPLVRMRTPFLGHSLISLPFLNYGGPLGSPGAQAALLEAALRESVSSRAGVLQIRNRTPLPVIAPSARPKVLVLLDLPPSPDTLWDGFPAKLRSQIRRAQREGLEFRKGPDQLNSFYSVFSRNMRDLGTPVYSRRFFEAIAARIPDFVIGAVYLRDEPIAAAAGFVWRGEFEMTWASSLRQYNQMAPNMLLYWSFMEMMSLRGVRAFNFGRSTPGSTTHRFKEQWGGVSMPLSWLEWSPHGGHGASGPSTAARLASKAWRRLPLPVANRLGPALSHRLPWW